MEVNFRDDRLKKLCELSAHRKKRFGEPVAGKLKARLDDLDAAQSLEDMRQLPGHWEELKGDRRGQFSCRLAGGMRLIVAPTRQPPPTKADGGLDWRAIDQVSILEVVDYHD
ncbi:MAG: type II toxin-antitoxin system RelE/ParE family toxin [Hydrogenophaga sp.]|nr:type II toxin-antitoxin system RelE/ParE family toxin [Hydrogenophaga sp.]